MIDDGDVNEFFLLLVNGFFIDKGDLVFVVEY